eukprot:CAMPEP_0182417356 /NCGR_PEP_ID=MMETSP1167-20130531/1797_1 /TAXON_ID=2988 /ORGANISM="Mallomonas Sp, Strain CCMP3275" /LENGTH=386 /DNA_ID=CAMNT_0024590843 /DNA_START=175 /DNA_END=1335 /DNA_ORIENTATION=-
MSVDNLALFGSTGVVAGVIAFHEAGHFLAAKWQGMKVSSYNIGYGPKIFGFNDTSDTEFALRAFPLGGYVAFPSNVEIDDNGEITAELTDPDLLQNRPPLQRALVISAGVLANILLTFLLATCASVTTGIAHPTFSPGVKVTFMPDPNSPAIQAGLRTNDIILKLNNRDVIGSLTTVDDFVAVIRSHPLSPMNVEYEREGERKKTIVTPDAAMGSGKGTIGIGISNRVESVRQEVAQNPIQALSEAAEETQLLLTTTWTTFSRTVSNGFTGSEVGGPLAVVQTGAQMASISPTALLGFAATLSINLAVLNALPFPALDGGQLAFVIVELIAGRPLPRSFQDSITTLAFAVLFGLGVSTIIGDVGKLSLPSFNDNTVNTVIIEKNKK